MTIAITELSSTIAHPCSAVAAELEYLYLGEDVMAACRRAAGIRS
jgi:hypothetical protein